MHKSSKNISNMNKLRRILILLLLVLSSEAYSQTYYFKNYEIDEGLPSNTVMCSIQDKRGFIWLGTKDGICRFDGRSFKLFGDVIGQQEMNGMTSGICEDTNGMIWFSNTGGVGYYDPDTDKVVRLEDAGGSMRRLICDGQGYVWIYSEESLVRYDSDYAKVEIAVPFGCTGACLDSYGEVWFTSGDPFLRHFNYNDGVFESMEIPELSLSGENAVCITDAKNRKLLVSTDRSRVFRYDILTGSAEFLPVPELKEASINCLLVRSDKDYWIACMNGLYRYVEGRGVTDFITNDDSHSIQDSNVISMYEDSDGNVWLGTFHNGISLWHSRTHYVSQFLPSGKENWMKGNLVRTIAGDHRGNVWVGTEDGYLNVFHIAEERITTLDRSSGLPEGLNYHGMVRVRNMMWIATFNAGVFVVDTDRLKMVRHYDVGNNSCGCIRRTRSGDIYVGGNQGLFLYDSASDSFVRTDVADGKWVHSLYEDSQGSLWVGTYGDGLFKVQGDVVGQINADTPNIGLPSDYIVSMTEDSDGVLWVATEGGGLCCTPTYGKPVFRSFGRKEGLPSNVACAIAEDDRNMLWVSTTKGLVEFDPVSMKVRNTYLDSNDTVGDNFSFGACYVSPSGAIHYGTNKGLLKFEPGILSMKDEDKPLYIVDIHSGADDRTTDITTQGRSAITSDRIRIKSRDAAYLSITFVCPNFSDINRMAYEYTFRSRRGEIHSIVQDNTVVFADTAPGKYEFNVKVAGSTSPDSAKELSIQIIPPFYASAFAIAVYVLLVLSLLYALFRQIYNKKERDKLHEKEIMEASKQKEIAEAKINFFTNITHEIRTPLTLIKLPVDKIVSSKEYTEESREDIMTIQANTTRLLNLTNQLLDIKKIEKRIFTLNLSEFDAAGFVRRIWSYFSAGIRERHLESSTDIPDREIPVYSDADFMEKIICNLISNAVKYTESFLSLKLEEDGDVIRVTVDSNGDRIPSSEAERIFEPFYQVKTVNSQLIGSNGTGLGLPYARNLANALGGSLKLDVDRKDCNSFVFECPVRAKDMPVAEEETKEVREVSVDGNRHWILVVEDAESMNGYLCKQLEKDYNMLSAANGEEAMEIIRNNKVDLVISDIMMPVMDGCELCNRIKKDVEFSHIPVILFTAAVGVETRIQTLEVGADGYIEKPFSIELLKANIDNLFKNRDIAYNQFANSPLSHFKSVVVNNIDQEFMDKLHTAVMDNISNQDLSIDTLTTLMFTSKSTLYRKVKANTGVNINEYIRISRLKKAAEMLATQKYRINEVAYLTGFSSPSYFATSFQKQFNVSPSVFVKNLGKKS